MGVTSKTGLLVSPQKKLIKYEQPPPVQFAVVAKTAPYILRPFAGLYNPYPYGCSLLCNHPADNEARELVKRAKDTWASEGRNLLLAEEVDAIRATLDQLQVKITDYGGAPLYDNENAGLPIGSVPEELFRRYTETDSRPLTPAPTLMSAHTRASGSRRCVTPDPMPTAEVREKTLLILDLRRSHSQETLSWSGGGTQQQQQQEVPSIKILKAPTDKRSTPTPYTPSCTPETVRKRSATRSSKTPSPVKSGKTDHDKVEKTLLEVPPEDKNDDIEDVDDEDEEEEEETFKRHGKKRRKRGRDSSRDPPAFQSSIDPETQVATIGLDSHNPSTRPSLVPTEQQIVPQQGTTEVQEREEATTVVQVEAVPVRRDSLDINSYLDRDTLKLLRRELNEEIIDNKFNMKRRLALEEAIKTIQTDRTDCDELKTIQKELRLVPTNEDMWLSIPRMFSRSSARFELPMDSRSLSSMTPLVYVHEHISISSSRKQLYNCIFNRHKNENEIESEHQRRLSGKNITTALNEMMGRSMTETQLTRIHDFVGWKDEDVLDFKTFCGLCALCERLLAPEYVPHMPSKKADPCHEIETVDFQSLERRLEGQKPDVRLVKILYAIRDS